MKRIIFGIFLCLPLLAAAQGVRLQSFTTNSGPVVTNIVRSLIGAQVTPTNLPFITPQQFGAVGDGTTDDWGPLMSWLNNAAKSNYVAFLPPAPGGSYVITKQLIVTNTSKLYGFHIMGAGGPFHVSDADDTKTFCCIKQTTPGTNGICITNDASGIVIENIRVIAATYDYRSKGIAFDGTTTDSDVCLIARCGVESFGKGIFIASAADTVIDNCSVGYCGEGLQMGPGTYSDGSIINNISVRNCQMSYANSNNIQVLKGNLSIYDTDIAQNNQQSGNTGTNSYGLYIGNAGQVRLFNCRFENNIAPAQARPCILATNGGALYMFACATDNAGGGGPANYSLVTTNCNVRIYACSLSALANDNYPILENASISAASVIYSDTDYPIKIVVNSTVYATRISQNLLHAFTDQSMNFGTWLFQEHSTYWNNLNVSQGGDDNENSLFVSAKFNDFTGAGAVKVDLFRYFKDVGKAIPGYNITLTNSAFITNTLYVGANTINPTNVSATTTAPDFNKAYTLLVTNAAFTILPPIGVDTTKTLAQTTVFMVTNSTAAAVAITAPANVHVLGVAFVTNLTSCTFFSYGGKFTNCIFLPVF